ncbi:MAG: sulfur carrier protein ThiS [Burkholderiales bacterium]|nr:sulfur carrier protein ThiS [Burkholderiales bacterium]MDE2394128.1 sulfur carrier protein ThiS [Burkholderiales bacterium]MDE2456241.1 sulfur carrier protein ThiS [Burkholderiales bacterium]
MAESRTDAAPVRVNGREMPWREGLTVAELVATQTQDPGALACALNGRFVARAERAATAVQPGDQLTLFGAIVGG